MKKQITTHKVLWTTENAWIAIASQLIRCHLASILFSLPKSGSESYSSNYLLYIYVYMALLLDKFLKEVPGWR